MYCFIDPFVLNQNIFLAHDPTKEDMSFFTKVALTDLPQFFAAKCDAKECDKIILYSGQQKYTEKIADEIREYGMINYGLNNIDIEIIRSK